MSSSKISQLPHSMTGAQTASNDLFPAVDTSEGETKKIARSELAIAVGAVAPFACGDLSVLAAVYAGTADVLAMGDSIPNAYLGAIPTQWNPVAGWGPGSLRDSTFGADTGGPGASAGLCTATDVPGTYSGQGSKYTLAGLERKLLAGGVWADPGAWYDNRIFDACPADSTILMPDQRPVYANAAAVVRFIYLQHPTGPTNVRLVAVPSSTNYAISPTGDSVVSAYFSMQGAVQVKAIDLAVPVPSVGVFPNATPNYPRVILQQGGGTVAADQVACVLETRWMRNAGGLKFTKWTIGGSRLDQYVDDTGFWTLARMTEYLAVAGHDTVFLSLGVNGWHFNTYQVDNAASYAAYAAIINRLRTAKPGVKIWLNCYYDLQDTTIGPGIRDIQTQLTQNFTSCCATNLYAHYPNYKIHNPILLGDGTHPNADGNANFARTIWNCARVAAIA